MTYTDGVLLFAVAALSATSLIDGVRLREYGDRITSLEREVGRLRTQVAALQPSTYSPAPAGPDDPVAYLSRYIARREGYHVPGSLPRRQHNPGSLVYAGQPGAVRGANGYARFPTPAAGFAALERDLGTKLARGADLGRAWPYLALLPGGE